jgi:hypothetical protein
MSKIELVEDVKKTRGKPAFCPTDEERVLVEKMASCGVPIAQIGAVVRDGIDHETVAKYFKENIVKGKAIANAKVGEALYQKAISGDVSAAIWWTKTQMRWSEVKQHEILGFGDSSSPNRIERIIIGNE